MHHILKQSCPSRQIAIFVASLFREIRVVRYGRNRTCDPGRIFFIFFLGFQTLWNGHLPEGRKWVSHQGFCLTSRNRTNIPTSLGWVNPNTEIITYSQMCAKFIQICYIGQFSKNLIKNHQKTPFFEKLLNIYVNPTAEKRQSQQMN